MFSLVPTLNLSKDTTENTLSAALANNEQQNIRQSLFSTRTARSI
jgi:hypothetical protein